MVTHARIVLNSLLVLLLGSSIALAQIYAPPSGRPAFSQQELDQMLAPIALYPDALLSQILMAATYPAEVVDAARWSRRNPGLDGDRAVRAVERMDWDPSVKSLVAFPQILSLMDEKLDWTTRLGDAFYAQQADVLDTVQSLRQKAYLAGNLGSTERLRVDRQGRAIVIELANPEVIYVPYYSPAVVYGTWWWPTYQPIHWASWPGYYARPGVVRGFAWGPGILISRNFFFGAADWHRRSVHVVNVNNYYYRPAHLHQHAETTRGAPQVWQHNPAHRRDVPYRQASLHQSAGHTSAAPEVRRDVRGHDRSTNERRGGPGSRPDAPGQHGNQPAAQASPPQVAGTHDARPNKERAPGASTVPATQPSRNVAAPIPSSSAAAPQPAGSPPVTQVSPQQVPATHDARPNQQRAPSASNVPAVAGPPAVRSAPSQPNAPGTVRPNGPAVASQSDTRSATNRPNVPAKANRPNVEQRPAAAAGIGDGANARKPDGRGGPASHQATPAGDRPAPASQPSGKAAATTPSDSASALQPAGNTRGHGGKRRDHE